jgi:hypothetical protein
MRESRDAAFLANFVSNSRTDEEGRAEIGVEGYPQKEEVSEKASPLQKEISVQLDVAYQRQSLLKAGVNGAGVAIGGLVSRSPIAVLTTIVPDLFLGSRWKHSRVFEFPVIDWGLRIYKFPGTVIHIDTDVWHATLAFSEGFVCADGIRENGLALFSELRASSWEAVLENGMSESHIINPGPLSSPTRRLLAMATR